MNFESLSFMSSARFWMSVAFMTRPLTLAEKLWSASEASMSLRLMSLTYPLTFPLTYPRKSMYSSSGPKNDTVFMDTRVPGFTVPLMRIRSTKSE